MRQVWQPLTIRCDSEDIAIEREISLSRCDKIKDVERNGSVIQYKQLTWDSSNEPEDD